MLNFVAMTGLFILISFLVSLTLSMATAEEKPKVILYVALKNFNLLCLIIIIICVVVSVINLL